MAPVTDELILEGVTPKPATELLKFVTGQTRSISKICTFGGQ